MNAIPSSRMGGSPLASGGSAPDHPRRPPSALAHVSIWGELGDVDHSLRHVDVGGVRTRVLQAGSGPDLILLRRAGGRVPRDRL
jgi:hypothetical protein